MTKIEVTFLGTGTTIPTKERNHSAIHLKYIGEKEYNLLFDCGEGTQRQMTFANLNFMAIDYVFITHWHADHCIGIFGLINSMNLEDREKPLIIFAPQAEKFGKMVLDFYRPKFEVRFVSSRSRGIKKILEEEEFRVFTYPVRHTLPTQAYAFVEKDRIKLDKEKLRKFRIYGRLCRILKEKGEIEKNGRRIKLEEVSKVIKGKKVVYSGDTEFFEEFREFAENSDLLIHDCTYFKREDVKEKMHSCVEDVLKFKDICKKLVLTHISRKYTSKKELERILKSLGEKGDKVIIAEDFLKISLE